MKLKKTIKKIITGAVLIAALAVFGISGYKIYSYMAEADREQNIVNTLSDNAVKVYADTTADSKENSAATTVTVKQRLLLQVDFDYLQSQNEDIKAWIYCPDTPINYPIAQSDDNDYYLHRLTDRTTNSAGTLFIDYRNKPDFTDLVTIIYGHNMKNSTMFGTLDLYKDQSYYDEHPVMYLDTKDDEYTVELISGYITDADSNTYIIPTKLADRDEYVNDTIKISTFNSGITTKDLKPTDNLVLLSTCSYEYQNARFVVVGVLR
jgi:sortase B